MYKDNLLEQRANLGNLIVTLDNYLKGAPKGNLRIMKKRKGVQYYHITKKNDTHGKYIKKQDANLVFELAKKDYYKRLKKEAKIKQNAIDRFINNYVDLDLSRAYSDLSTYRKDIVEPLFISDEEYAKKWISIPYEHLGFAITDFEYYTKKDLRVRSKSEIFIGDTLDEMGVFYKYECPIKINGQNVFVDFTILNPHTRKEIYFEHFGRMSEESYLKDFFLKQSSYIRNGIVLGQNFYATFESKQNPLNTKDMRNYLYTVFGDCRL